MRCRAMVRGSDQPQTNRFRSLLTVSHVDRDPLASVKPMTPDARAPWRAQRYPCRLDQVRRSQTPSWRCTTLPCRVPRPWLGRSAVIRAFRPRATGLFLLRPYWRPAQNLRHLWPFCRGLGAHLKYRARRYAILSAALDHAYLSGAPRNARSARTRATKIENRCFRERLFLTPAPRLQAHDHSEVERRVFDKQVRRQCPAGRVELRAASRNGMASDRGLAM
jgi:hypothetical protein